MPLVEAGRIPVTQGFIGATATGIATTLGRGSSDFTPRCSVQRSTPSQGGSGPMWMG